MAKATTRARRGDSQDGGEDFDANVPREALIDDTDLPPDTVMVGDNSDRGVALKITPDGMDGDDENWDLPQGQTRARTRTADRREAEDRQEDRRETENRDPYGERREDRREAEYEYEEDEDRPRLSRRARRNRADKQRDVQARSEIERLQQTVGGLKETIDRLSGGQYQLTTSNVDTQIRATQQALELCNGGMAKAIEDNNGEEFARIQGLRDQAIMKLGQLNGAKTRLEDYARKRQEEGADNQEDGEARGGRQKTQESGLSAKAQQKIGVFMERNPWFNPKGEDWLSRRVRELDAELLADGEDPEQSDYWNELETRMAEEGIGRNGRMSEDERRRPDEEDDRPSSRRDSRDEQEERRPRRPPTRGGRGGSGGGRPGFQLDDHMIDILRQEGLLGNNLNEDDQKRRGRYVDSWRAGMDKLRRVSAR